MADTLEETLLARVKILHDTVWEQRAGKEAIKEWLDNFTGKCGDPDAERVHALFLLSVFIYFGSRQTRCLLKAMFRDLYRYPIIESIRRANQDTIDSVLIERDFRSALERTRFLGIGNPSESGSHLLYYYRQENRLPKTQFIHAHQILDRRGAKVALKDATVDRYVFIDDFCGSGTQGKAYSEDILRDLKTLSSTVRCEYHVLFATEKGKRILESETLFDAVGCIFELDDSFKCFSQSSRYFVKCPSEITQAFALQVATHYGKVICPGAPLGYGDCQLLLGFHHNTPDNTLPIFWYEEPEGSPWSPVFRRFSKYYGWSSP